MSLKNLFGKSSGKILIGTTPESASLEIESYDLFVEEIEERQKFVPYVDFTEPSNFAFYGSAEKYYTDAIQNIYKKYPYDGSLYEKIKWKKESSNLENYIFDNEYPRNNGYVNIGYSYGTVVGGGSNNYFKYSSDEYIFFKGGPNTSENLEDEKIKSLFGTSNIYDKDTNRESNLEINGANGLTVEFWLKKNNLSGSSKQVIFDLWNSASYGTSNYGRLRIEIHPGISAEQDKFYIELMSGSSGIFSLSLGNNLPIASGSWNHYSIAACNSGSAIQFNLYKNGIINDTKIVGTNIGKIYGSMLGWIGSLGTSVAGLYAGLGYGKLSGSIDEFRYWKTKRTDKEINKYWFTQVGGGTNTDDANTHLGVYYKFNEGIFNTSSVDFRYDTKILDYSGRFSNGYWTGYALGSRDTGSAIILSEAADKEFKDPVIYSEHPDVQSLLISKQELGKLHDSQNTSYMYYTFPSWIVEQDQQNERNRLLELSQIISSYFDELFLKIKYLPTLKETVYRDGRQLPYGMKLLQSMGFITEDLFTDSSVLENIENRNENFQYEDRLFNLKNHIYQNIYNNLLYIQRSKGTEKSIRNLIRCFGIDDDLVKLNIYSNDSEFIFDNRYTLTTTRKKYINFNDSDRFQGSIYQATSSLDANSVSFISGNIYYSHVGQTFQTEIIFPLKYEPNDKIYFNTYFLTSSLFGMHEANGNNQADYTWVSGDKSNLEVYAIREDYDSKDGYLFLTSSYLGINITSSLIKDLYTNQKWNFAIRMKHENYPISDFVLGADSGKYIFEFSGINSIQDTVYQSFKLTSSVQKELAEQYFASNKRIYAGSHRQNFTGSILCNSDIKISSIRYWLSYLNDETLEEHSKDANIYGNNNVYSNIDIFSKNLNYGLDIPQNNTLVLYWDFNQVTGSNNGTGIGPVNSYDANFYIEDVTSGSLTTYYGTIGQTVRKRHTGIGNFFLRNKNNMVENIYVQTAKHKSPENVASSEMIQILNADEEIFSKDTAPVSYYFAIEKSMYQTISDEMLKMFGTILDFNNLIGKPQYKYEREYRHLVKLREMFFAKISNSPDLEKYVDYYKWIDASITKMIMQLIPASADFSDEISNLVESHIFERNKYAYKLPSIELGQEPPITSVKTIGELKYNWKYGSAPIQNKENTNCLWWKDRKERSKDLDGIFKVLSSTQKRNLTKIFDFDISFNSYIDKNPTNLDVIKPITKFGSGGYLEIDVLQTLQKKDCTDE